MIIYLQTSAAMRKEPHCQCLFSVGCVNVGKPGFCETIDVVSVKCQAQAHNKKEAGEYSPNCHRE